MRLRVSALGAIVFCFFSSFMGCAYNPPISDEGKYELNKPIDCTTARQDIKILESEKQKADTDDQVKSGVKMFVPAAAARAILHGDYAERKEVATGEYYQALDKKIKEIKAACGC